MRKTPSLRSRQVVIGIALLALGWASIVLSVRYDLLVPPSLALEVTGGALLLVGVAMRILAFKEIPSTYHIKDLVTSGVYAKTRNPIYFGFILMIVGVAVLSRGVLVFIWDFASVFVLYYIARSEEIDLERIFGERYLSYKSSVPMFLPRFWNTRNRSSSREVGVRL